MKYSKSFSFIALSFLFLFTACTKDNSLYTIDETEFTSIETSETFAPIEDEISALTVTPNSFGIGTDLQNATNLTSETSLNTLNRNFPMKIVTHACIGGSGEMIMQLYDDQSGKAITNIRNEYQISMTRNGEALRLRDCFCGGTVNVYVTRLRDGAVARASYQAQNCFLD